MAFSITDVFLLMGLGFSLAAPLGPVNMEMLKQTLSKRTGYVLGLITGIGAMSGDFIIAMSILTLGQQFSNLLEIDSFRFVLFVINAFILAYIGRFTFTVKKEDLAEKIENPEFISYQNDKSDVPKEEAIQSTKVVPQFGLGLFLVTTSPWSYFWWASFGPYIIESGIPISSMLDRLQAVLLFLFGIFLWIVIYVGILGIMYRQASPEIILVIIRISGLIIYFFALQIALEAAKIVL